MNSEPEPIPSSLEPLPYHRLLVDYLQAHEADLWRWFSGMENQASQLEALRTELLKEHYRLEAEAHPAIHEQARAACERLGLTVPVTLYQAGQQGDLNAQLCHLPGEAHVILSGPLLTLLGPMEMQALLGHELAHYQLWEREGGAYLIADRLILSQAADPRAQAVHLQTARRLRLYTEIFADRGAYLATGDLHATVGALVKTHTGLESASGESYLRQAREIFERGHWSTAGLSHPEAYIRARALQLWAEEDAETDAKVAAMIEGEPRLEELDLLAQVRLSALVRRWLGQLLRPVWFQTPLVLAHARLFFPDFQWTAQTEPDLAAQLRFADKKTREFLAFVLLDFATADPDLADLPLAAAIAWSRRLELGETFDALVLRELKIKPREFARLKKESAAMLVQAEAEAEAAAFRLNP